MTGGSNIRAIGPEDTSDQDDTTVLETDVEYVTEEDSHELDWENEAITPRRLGWLLPVLAVLAVSAWTGFYVWANRSEILAGGSPQQWSGWIVAWAVPVLLVVALWLLAMRNSRREAMRFGETAQLLSAESQLLEDRLTAINRELSLAREFLGSQSLELDSLGRIATERLSEHADRLQSLIVHNGEQVDSIASVSITALENMVKLRDDLPVISNSSRDVSNQIATAGRTAQTQVAELVAGFERLNDFGQASEQQVRSLDERVGNTLVSLEKQLETLENAAEARFTAMREQSEAFRTELDGREIEVHAAIRRRGEALGEELSHTRQSLDDVEEEALKSLRSRLVSLRDEAGTVGNAVREREEAALAAWSGQVDAIQTRLAAAIEEIQGIDEAALASAKRKLEALKQDAETIDSNIAERDAKLLAKIMERQRQLADNEKQALAALDERLSSLDAAIAERQEAQIRQAQELAGQGEAITARLTDLEATIEKVAQMGTQAEESIAQGLITAREQLDTSRETIDTMGEPITELTEATVRLLELIQASAQHSNTELPNAIGIAEDRLTDIEGRADRLKLMLGEANDKSAELSDYVVDASNTGRQAIENVDVMQVRLSAAHEETVERIDDLQAKLATLSAQSDILGEKAAGELNTAIMTLETAVRSSADAVEVHSIERVRNLADKIGEETAQAVDRSIRAKATESIGDLERATAQATEASRGTLLQMRDQLAKVNELAGNLETRVARARERAEEQVDNDFARRMALISESLNSNSIDIAKALSSEVTDTDWASYLRGDRGIFTRRAVRLLDNIEAREIAELYDADPDFQENVSRYIADFEGMLRTMLSTRDGNALGVTLLSSDMGKLYVALAQGIERLRD